MNLWAIVAVHPLKFYLVFISILGFTWFDLHSMISDSESVLGLDPENWIILFLNDDVFILMQILSVVWKPHPLFVLLLHDHNLVVSPGYKLALFS